MPHKDSDDLELLLNIASKQEGVGETLAHDLLSSVLEKGEPITLSEMHKFIHKTYKYQPSAVENGFLEAMLSFSNEGIITILSIEGGDSLLIHSDHVEAFLATRPDDLPPSARATESENKTDSPADESFNWWYIFLALMVVGAIVKSIHYSLLTH